VQEFQDLTQSIAQAGHLRGRHHLRPTSTATTVRIRNGKRETIDGPFAETREQIGGYFVIEAANLDEAVGIAARIPAARTGSVEVRPVVES
jgi:hypothetical protein